MVKCLGKQTLALLLCGLSKHVPDDFMDSIASCQKSPAV